MKFIKQTLSIWIFTIISLLVSAIATSILLFIAYEIEVAIKIKEEALDWNVLGAILSFLLSLYIWGKFLKKQRGKNTKFSLFFKKLILLN